MNQYLTTELEVASFLKARGHHLIDATSKGRLIEFAFGPSASEDVGNYIAGEAIPARNLFEAHRSLRALIQQVKQHNQNRSENTSWNNNSQ